MYCKHCGTEISGNAKFCGKCGKRTESVKPISKHSTKKKMPIFLLVTVVLLVLIITVIPVLGGTRTIEYGPFTYDHRDIGYTTMLVNHIDGYFADEFNHIMATTRITYVFTVVISFAVFVFSYLEKDVFAFLMSVVYFPIIAFCVYSVISQTEEIHNCLNLRVNLSIILLLASAICVFTIFMYCLISMVFSFAEKHKRKN